MKACLLPYKNLAARGVSHLAVQICDHTGYIFDLDFSVQIFERHAAVQIFVQLAWFNMNLATVF